MFNLNQILCCPRCRTALAEWRCKACQIEFPVYDDVPWLVAEPDATRYEWRNRWQLALAELERGQRQARDSLARKTPDRDLGPATRDRLSNLAEGYAAQHQALKQLLKSLGLAKPANLETYLALKTRLPAQMRLTGYQANVFRDWCWGELENQASLEAVTGAVAAHDCDSVLILGAGAGRLAYDLHQTLKPSLSVALELNPYLTTVLKTLAEGRPLTLTEFPVAPRAGNRCAISRTLTADAAAGPGFEVVLADAMQPPFMAESFDTVITPWLLDVIDGPTGVLLGEINRLLRPGGRWIYHGSLAFDRPALEENLNTAELEALALDNGLTVRGSSAQISPYLDCPDSRHGRREEILTIQAEKTAPVEPQRHQNLPDWIAGNREPIPALPSFQSQAMATRIHAFIMSLIDGRRSLKDIALLMEEQQLMPQEEAETAIRGFLIKMFDEASSGRGF